MEDLEIGIAILNYDRKGKLISGLFTPTLAVEVPDLFKETMETITATTTPDLLKTHSDMVFAGFFVKMNEIELADREDFDVVSEVIECEKWNNGIIRKCIIKYFFKKVR